MKLKLPSFPWSPPKRSPHVWQAPGTLIPIPDATPSVISVWAYGRTEPEHQRGVDSADLDRWLSAQPVTWIDMEGLADVEAIKAIGDRLGLHPLALEDVLNLQHRPKVEVYEDHLFIVLRLPSFDADGALRSEQVSLFVGEGWVVTLQEWQGDCFENVRERLRSGRAQIRTRGADYLAYALIDAVVDSYFPVLETYADRLDRLEGAIAERTEPEQLTAVQATKRGLRRLRRAVWPQRGMIATLLRDDTPVIDATTHPYLRDCGDHADRILDLVESYREWSADLSDYYLSIVNTRMNDVMRVLTIIATIFIPLTFVAGIYGMNFDPAASRWNMPELAWRFGYPLVLFVMGGLAVALVVFFRRKGWIGK